jgi:hypothetical protein
MPRNLTEMFEQALIKMDNGTPVHAAAGRHSVDGKNWGMTNNPATMPMRFGQISGSAA